MDKGQSIGYSAQGAGDPAPHGVGKFFPLVSEKYHAISNDTLRVTLAWSLHDSNKPQDEEQP